MLVTVTPVVPFEDKEPPESAAPTVDEVFPATERTVPDRVHSTPAAVSEDATVSPTAAPALTATQSVFPLP